MHGDDRVERIGLFGEHRLGLEFFGKFEQSRNLAGEVWLGVLAFSGEFEVGFDVIGAAS